MTTIEEFRAILSEPGAREAARLGLNESEAKRIADNPTLLAAYYDTWARDQVATDARSAFERSAYTPTSYSPTVGWKSLSAAHWFAIATGVLALGVVVLVVLTLIFVP